MQPFFFIRQEGRNLRVDIQDVLYIESRKNYTRLVMENRPAAMVLVALKHWERILPGELFCRIHRGYIVSIGKVRAFDARFAWLAGEKLPIGEQYRTALPDLVTILSSDTGRKEVLRKWEN
ncbi:MAG TPA: LytTR family DNA-binding domain-containing protein [Puia sp.]|nr:LytTR family DNA-binding domain-containing protein [Puia sp.]